MNKLFIKILIRGTKWIPFRRIRYKLRHWIHLNMESCEWELKNIESLIPTHRGLALDIGANYGHYSGELIRYFDRVYAFEINPELTKDLQCINSGISVFNIGLSSVKKDATLYIPIHPDSTPLVGWANLEKSHPYKLGSFQKKTVYLDLLDSCLSEPVDFIKIDVEGHELEVLKGAKETLIKYNPHLLIEIQPTHLKTVRSFLQNLDYTEKNLGSEGEEPKMANFFFCKLKKKA